MNEVDTGDIVKAMLGDMLGYDPFFEVSTDIGVRGAKADYAVLSEGKIRFLLIVKGIGCALHPVQLLRLSGSNSTPYSDWVVLTNAECWLCFRLGVGHDRHPELVFQVSLTDSLALVDKVRMFLLISKESAESDALTRYYENTYALNSGRLVSLLLSEELLNILRREILLSTNYRPELQLLREVLTRNIIHPNALATYLNTQSAPSRADCYAYVADPNDIHSWRLLYRDTNGIPDPDRLLAAARELESDPRKLNIPADDLPLVKQRLRSAYIELGVSIEDIPPLLKT